MALAGAAIDLTSGLNIGTKDQGQVRDKGCQDRDRQEAGGALWGGMDGAP
jgi:hypothetical protein